MKNLNKQINKLSTTLSQTIAELSEFWKWFEIDLWFCNVKLEFLEKASVYVNMTEEEQDKLRNK